jgi:hypothetical protein
MTPIRTATYALTVLLVALITALSAVAANAHGGNRVVEVVAGPYIISAFVSHAAGQIDETVGVIDAESRAPVRDATVAITLERDGERIGPFVARSLDGSYEVRYPRPDGDRWSVLIEVNGPNGSAAARHAYRSPAGDGWSGPTGLLINLLLLALLVAGAVLLPRLGRPTRRKRAPADGTLDGV